MFIQGSVCRKYSDGCPPVSFTGFPPLSFSFMVLCSFQSDFPYFTVQLMCRGELALPHWSASRLSPISLSPFIHPSSPPHTPPQHYSHLSMTITFSQTGLIIKDWKRIQNYRVTDTRQVSLCTRCLRLSTAEVEQMLFVFGLTRSKFLSVQWSVSFFFFFFFPRDKNTCTWNYFSLANNLSSLCILVCRFFALFQCVDSRERCYLMDNTSTLGKALQM